MEEHKRNHLLIDDLGYEEDDENARVNDFGSKTDIVVEVVRRRYEIYQQFGLLTHFSTNKTTDQIEELYGGGTSSRIQEMCNIQLWHGENYRAI